MKTKEIILYVEVKETFHLSWCPNCESVDLTVLAKDGEAGVSCKMQGPVGGKREAVELWNRLPRR